MGAVLASKLRFATIQEAAGLNKASFQTLDPESSEENARELLRRLNSDSMHADGVTVATASHAASLAAYAPVSISGWDGREVLTKEVRYRAVHCIQCGFECSNIADIEKHCAMHIVDDVQLSIGHRKHSRIATFKLLFADQTS